MSVKAEPGEKQLGAQTAERALYVLDVLADHGGRLRLSDLAQASGLNISTTSRLLGALERFGHVERDAETGRYRLGYKILQLAQVVLDQTPLPELAGPILAWLMEVTDETATLNVPHDGAAMVLARVECTSPLRTVAHIGHHGPLYCTAHGKAMLAHMPEEEVRAVLDRGMPRLTDLTITTREGMATELARVRAQGYAVDLGEREPGLVSIAAPVRDASRRVVATVGISGSGQRLGSEVIGLRAGQVMEAAMALSDRLGWKAQDSSARSWSDRSPIVNGDTSGR